MFYLDVTDLSHMDDSIKECLAKVAMGMSMLTGKVLTTCVSPLRGM